MPTFQFAQVNVFSADPLGGNPLAVVHTAEGLSEAQMAALARWTNLSETTFLLPPTDLDADYYVRIFTPGGELPFAGHPTLGSCHAWLAAGGKPRKPGLVVQQCGVGLVRVRCDGPRLEFAAPPLLRTGALEPDVLAKIAKAGHRVEGDQLKRVPAPYAGDHPRSDLIRRRSLNAWRDLDDPALVAGQALLPEVLATFEALTPLVSWLQDL